MPLSPRDEALRTIDASRLRALLNDDAGRWLIEVVEQTGSTNADVLARLREPPRTAAPMVRAAYGQSAGRGRRGRAWLGEAGDSLMFSVGYCLPRPLHALGGLSLAVGTALLNGLRTLPLDDARRLSLKWPNDVLLDGDKLGGVLLETAWSNQDACAVVIGVGLNLRGAHALRSRLVSTAASEAPLPSPSPSSSTSPGAVTGPAPAELSSVLPAPCMTDVFAALLNALAVALRDFGISGFAPFGSAWNADHAYAGKAVVLSEGGTVVTEGIAQAVDGQGRLLVATENGIRAITSLDVSLRVHGVDARAGTARQAVPNKDGGR